MGSKVISKVHKAGQARVWLQVNGPGSAFLYGGCYGMNDITIPKGDRTPIFCPSPTQPEKWDIVDYIKGTPGNPTSSLEAPLELVNYLLTLDCPFGVQVRYSPCSTPENPDSWETMFNFRGVEITQSGITQINGRDPANNNLSMQTADVIFMKMTFVKKLTVSSVTVAGASASLRGISFCDDPSCPGDCGVGSAGCQVGYVVTSGLTAGEQVWKTENGGNTWTAQASPFTSIYDDVVDIACKGDIVIVVNGTATGKIARSQDGGTTWAIVSLPDAIVASSVFMLDVNRVWVTGATGYVWYSDDGGQTWTTQEAGTATAEDLNSIFFFDSLNGWAVGANGAIIATTDGGDNWSAQTSGTANELNAVHFISRWVGYAGGASGTLLVTTDGGTTWTVKTWFGAATNIINAITSCEENFVLFGGTTFGGAGFIYQSVDGGSTAYALTLPSNTGVNDLVCCAPDTLFAATPGGTILKGT